MLSSLSSDAWVRSGERIAASGADASDPVADALRLGRELAAAGLLPGSGRTAELWSAFVAVGARDLAAVRALEPHVDAVAILAQAGDAPERCEGASWGVYASEGGPAPVRAERRPDGRWRIDGTKEWCSLADRLDAALVSATAEDGRRLFAVDLRAPGVRIRTGDWHARGLTEIPSGAVDFDAVIASPVGGPGWYLERPGFQWGGIGVAACWLGGALGLARTLRDAAAAQPDRPFTLAHLGAVDEQLHSADLVLEDAARAVDAGEAVGEAGRLLAQRVRASVARTAEDVLRRVGHALGPAPLAKDPDHAKRVADLTLYLRQHHAERDEAALGSAVVTASPW